MASPLLLIAGVVGAGYLVLRKKKPAKSRSLEGLDFIAPKDRKPEETEVWPRGFYTEYFTEATEEIIAKALREIRAREGISECKRETTWTPGSEGGVGGTTSGTYPQADKAALEVARQFYPSGAFPAHDKSPIWQRWVWTRLKFLADKEVCRLSPVL